MTAPTLLALLLASAAPVPDGAVNPDSAAIVVTANRAPTDIDRVASAITVLTKPDIDREQDLTIPDLLQRTPGIAVSRNGGFGTDTTLRLRGAPGDQTVIVLDGVKLTDPASPDGSFNLGTLLTDDAARVEVLRGPQSTLWGSQAIGGVVNIVTALPDKPLEGSFDVQGGSRRTADARAGVGGKDGRLTWRLAGEAFTTDGISALDSRYGGTERDGYSNRSAQGRVNYALTDAIGVDLRGFASSGRTDIDGFDPVTFANVDTSEYETNRQLLGYAGLNAAFFDGRWRNRIGFSYTDTRRNNLDPRLIGDDTTFHSNGSTRRLDYEGTLDIVDGWNAVFGVERERSRFRSISPQYQVDPDGGDATLTDEYLQLNGTIVRGLTLTGGVRHDDYTSYGSRFLFSGGAAWKLPTNTVLRASYGEGFKAPSLYQLYSEYGNADLSPTRTHGWEAGVEQHLLGDRLTLGGNYFERRTRGLVVFNSCYGTAPGTDALCDTHALAGGYYLNLDRSATRGVEVAGSARPIDRLTLSGNFSWIHAVSVQDGPNPWLPRQPRTLANGEATYSWPFGLSTGVAVRRAGHSYDDATNFTRLGGYTLVDLRAELPVAHGLTLFARAENVGNVRYETVYRYGALGRSIYAGVRARL